MQPAKPQNTRLMSLKDDAGLIKMYAMVDATDYQKVATVSIDEGLEALKDNFISENINDFHNSSLKEATITIKNITFLNSSGITKAFIVSSDDKHYKVELNEENEEMEAEFTTSIDDSSDTASDISDEHEPIDLEYPDSDDDDDDDEFYPSEADEAVENNPEILE